MTIKDFANKLRRAADMLDELQGITLHNETNKTAKKILKDRDNNEIKYKRGPYKKHRKNPWNNPKYRTKMLKHMAMMRKAKKAKS